MGAPSVLSESGEGRYADLYAEFDTRVRSTVDTDEMAAFLEAGGLNDRIIARRFGSGTVFELAARLRADRSDRPAVADEPEPVEIEPAVSGSWALASAVRAALYLTPAVLAVAGAQQLSNLPAVAGTGALIYGWAVAQALSFLGYRALGAAGPVRAARLLGLGFLAAAAGWAVVMALFGVTDLRSQLVAAGQLVLFSATAVGLVTGGERRVLAAATSVWASAGILAITGQLWVIAPALLLLLGVAYHPVIRRADKFRPLAREAGAALAHGAVGAGQALLFASVVLTGTDAGRLPVASLPLLIGVPAAELVLAWHQRRIAQTRAVLTDRIVYAGHLARVAAGTVLALTVPALVGIALAAAGAVTGTAAYGRLAASVLLTGVFALCLVLVAHNRLGLATLLVWWPALLIGLLYRTVPGAAPDMLHSLVAVVLFAVCLPGLGVVLMVLRDRWSYR